ncbi:hypothetical protein F5876DRAFT_81006 [Lentinula aff. lateritia]|uniref:Uncharacterized protein n=1 Tax=Lentinula aff. lateritia TaxID=2804960 RepID=A0ACC1TN50_9AGAR|nr:hypothetical protein F5876DRAFT_81006 [Lentinula aff. lateritia]
MSETLNSFIHNSRKSTERDNHHFLQPTEAYGLLLLPVVAYGITPPLSVKTHISLLASRLHSSSVFTRVLTQSSLSVLAVISLSFDHLSVPVDVFVSFKSERDPTVSVHNICAIPLAPFTIPLPSVTRLFRSSTFSRPMQFKTVYSLLALASLAHAVPLADVLKVDDSKAVSSIVSRAGALLRITYAFEQGTNQVIFTAADQKARDAIDNAFVMAFGTLGLMSNHFTGDTDIRTGGVFRITFEGEGMKGKGAVSEVFDVLSFQWQEEKGGVTVHKSKVGSVFEEEQKAKALRAQLKPGN